ncbi:MAG: hypothetical protein ACRC5R_05295 [Mycoplasmatales bacterium]
MKIKIVGKRVSLLSDNIEVGFAIIDDVDIITILDLYVFPGYRNQRFAYVIIEGIIEYAHKNHKHVLSDCWYARYVFKEKKILINSQ